MTAAASAGLATVAVALFPFALSTSVTPGPNNLMVTVSALNFGFVRTLPHMLGITVGFPVMLLAVGFGLGQLFITFPALHRLLGLFGAAYLLYLAWKIATAASGPENTESGPPSNRPITFLQAALFQWVNPKAWIMALGAVTTYTTPKANFPLQVFVIALIFAIIAFPSVALWAVFGRSLSHALRSQLALRIFNYTMAALLVASLAFLSFN